MYRSFFKPLFDRVGAILALIILGPVILVVAVMVRIKLGSPVLFSQIRPGKDEKPFRLYKFRSMTNKMNEEGELMEDSNRLDGFGRFLRSSSLDELPELFNILRGEMSFVGPRPLLMKYLPLYNEEQRKRHLLKPGLTGYAQIMGRNLLTWNEKFSYDVRYVEKCSFWMDTKIFVKTIIVAIERKGISSASNVTMEDFLGN